MGYTKFGKSIRKLMIDNDENLKDIASVMGVSTAFVSSVLTGKKNIPDSWYDDICAHYKLDEDSSKKLYDVYCECKNAIKIDVEDKPIESKKLVIQFQRTLPNLSEEEIQQLWDIIGKK